MAIVVSVVSVVALKVAAKQQTIHKQLKAKGVKITWKTPLCVWKQQPRECDIAYGRSG